MATLRPDAFIHFFPGGPGALVVNRAKDIVVSKLQPGGNPLCYSVDASFAPRAIAKGHGQAEGVIDAINASALSFHRVTSGAGGLPDDDEKALAMLREMMLKGGAHSYFNAPTLGIVGRQGMRQQAKATIGMLLSPFGQYINDDNVKALNAAIDQAFADPEVMAKFATPEISAKHNAADHLLSRIMEIMASSGADSTLVNFIDHIRLQHFAENEFDQLMSRMRQPAMTHGDRPASTKPKP
jgi:hypothetical protein